MGVFTCCPVSWRLACAQNPFQKLPFVCYIFVAKEAVASLADLTKLLAIPFLPQDTSFPQGYDKAKQMAKFKK